MESLNKAEWVLKAAAQCSLDPPPTCIDGKLELSLKESVEYKYIDDINIRSTKPHLYEAQKSVLAIIILIYKIFYFQQLEIRSQFNWESFMIICMILLVHISPIYLLIL